MSSDTPTLTLTHPGGTIQVPLSFPALTRVRYTFELRELPTVERLKLLTAALLSEIEQQRTYPPAHGPSSESAREWATAATHVQTACMFAVAAATAHLAK